MTNRSYCTYCGEPSDTKDHVVPHSTLTTRPRSTSGRAGVGDVVPCCGECNNLLGTQMFPTIQARAAYLAHKYKSRYAKLIKAPVWDADELAELGPTLRSSILEAADRKRNILARINHAADGELVLARASQFLSADRN